MNMIYNKTDDLKRDQKPKLLLMLFIWIQITIFQPKIENAFQTGD